MKTAPIAVMVLFALSIGMVPAPAADVVTTVVTDADAYVEAEYWSSDHQNNNYGSNPLLCQGIISWARHSYMHFDLSGLDAGAEVTEARLRVEWQATLYDPGVTRLYAIMDDAKEWDLTALPETGATGITWLTAPQNGAYNEVPFLEEGEDASAVTRLIGTNPTATGTSTPIDLDVTDLVKWLLGQSAAYSDLADANDLLTVCFREGTQYAYADYASREYTPEDDADAPRLVITQGSGPVLPHPGDAQPDGKVDGGDYTIWADNYAKTDALPWSEGGWVVGNFTEDTNVDGGDYTIWADEYGYGTGGAAVPEPVTLGLLVIGAVAAIRRRK
ncbi:MAG TPA: DNRLRE domain-containing protein [Phycisphaerae bacterium]|nr:DNRLRE domain-containing protein [Phycisphaerae bacterium]